MRVVVCVLVEVLVYDAVVDDDAVPVAVELADAAMLCDDVTAAETLAVAVDVGDVEELAVPLKQPVVRGCKDGSAPSEMPQCTAS